MGNGKWERQTEDWDWDGERHRVRLGRWPVHPHNWQVSRYFLIRPMRTRVTNDGNDSRFPRDLSVLPRASPPYASLFRLLHKNKKNKKIEKKTRTARFIRVLVSGSVDGGVGGRWAGPDGG